MTDTTHEQTATPLWTVIALFLALVDQVKEISNQRAAWRQQVLLELKRLGGRNPGTHIGELVKLGESLEEGATAVDATIRQIVAKAGEHAPPEAMEFFKLLQPELEASAGNETPSEGGGYPHLPNHDRANAQAVPLADQAQAYAPDGREGTITATDDTLGEVQLTFPDGSREWFALAACKDCETEQPLAPSAA